MKKETLLAISISISIGLFSAIPVSADPCESPDNLTEVTGAKECLVIQTYHEDPNNKTLVVFIHGNTPRGYPSDYMKYIAFRFRDTDTTEVILIRPGYHDSKNRKSTGTRYNRNADWYRKEIVNSVADAIQRLKAHHKSERVVLVGYSGGAAISGVILGRHPGLARAAVLISCPCDVGRWRRMHHVWVPSNDLSPHRFIDKIPGDNSVITVSGGKNRHTVPSLARDYVEKLTQRGIDAEFVLVPRGSHDIKMLRGAAVDALEKLIANP